VRPDAESFTDLNPTDARFPVHYNEARRLIGFKRRNLALCLPVDSRDRDWLIAAWEDSLDDQHPVGQFIGNWPPHELNAAVPPGNTTQTMNPLLIDTAPWNFNTIARQEREWLAGNLRKWLEDTADHVPSVLLLEDTGLARVTNHRHRVFGHQLLGTPTIDVIVSGSYRILAAEEQNDREHRNARHSRAAKEESRLTEWT
jgi:hypothetical protein